MINLPGSFVQWSRPIISFRVNVSTIRQQYLHHSEEALPAARMISIQQGNFDYVLHYHSTVTMETSISTVPRSVHGHYYYWCMCA